MKTKAGLDALNRIISRQLAESNYPVLIVLMSLIGVNDISVHFAISLLNFDLHIE
jgi:hypothetical protein